MTSRLAAAAALGCALTVAARGASPPGVDSMLADLLRLDRGAIEQIRHGNPVATSLPGALEREILVGGSIRIGTSSTRVVELFRDIERLEQGKGFVRTVRLSEPPVSEDFATLELPAGDIQDLRRCHVGACKLELPQRGFELLAGVNWKAADPAVEVNAMARRLALDLVRAYRAGGAEALGPTLEERLPHNTAAEFAQMMSGKPFLETATPGLAAYLSRYPRGARPQGLDEFFYWSLIEFGLKPTFRLNHVVIYPLAGSRWVVANRLIWASHYFQNAVEVRLLVDDAHAQEPAHYLLVLNLARPDGLTGVFGPVVRYKVRSGSRDTLRKTMSITKRLAETGVRESR
jgi:hypothetical protein